MTAPPVSEDHVLDEPKTSVRSRRIVQAAVIGLLVAVIAVVAFLGYQRSSLATVEANRSEVIDVASEQTIEMLSYTPDNVEDKLRAAADGLTESFSGEYLDLLDSVVIPTARETGTTTEVTVAGAAVTEVERSTASVLLFLNQTTSTSAAQEPVVSGSRLLVDLEKVDGRWLVSDMNPS